MSDRPPRYRKINGHWYVLSTYMGERMEAVIRAFKDGLASSSATAPQSRRTSGRSPAQSTSQANSTVAVLEAPALLEEGEAKG